MKLFNLKEKYSLIFFGSILFTIFFGSILFIILLSLKLSYGADTKIEESKNAAQSKTVILLKDNLDDDTEILKEEDFNEAIADEILGSHLDNEKIFPFSKGNELISTPSSGTKTVKK